MNTDGEGTLEEQKKARILAAVNKCGTFKLAARELGCCPRTVSTWMRKMKARREPHTIKWRVPSPASAAGAAAARAGTAFHFPDFSNTETHHSGPSRARC